MFTLNKKEQKVKEMTSLEKYSIPPIPYHCFVFDHCKFDTGWELAVYIWALDNTEKVLREPIGLEYEFEGKKWMCWPDFEIDGQLIEVRGPQFFTKEGILHNPYDPSENERLKIVQQVMIDNGVQFWGEKEVAPILSYVEDLFTPDFIPLFDINIPFPYPPLRKTDDYSLIRHFHKSIFDAFREGCMSPREAWNYKDLIVKSALNRLRYVGSCTPYWIVQGFNIAKIAPKVSIFRPTLAERLINNYLKEYPIIVDPFSGFSGRMLGAMRCHKTYKGFDIHPDHVRESNDIIQYKHLLNCTVELQDLIEAPVTQCNKSTALFTCPPYAGKEQWPMPEPEKTLEEMYPYIEEEEEEPDDGLVKKSCDAWIDLCMEKYPGCGTYLFVVDVTDKYKDCIVESIRNKSHFGTNHELVLKIER